MGFDFTNALGIHDNALKLRSQRAEVIGNNLANADTPGFQARAVDFQALLEKAEMASSSTAASNSEEAALACRWAVPEVLRACFCATVSAAGFRASIASVK